MYQITQDELLFLGSRPGVIPTYEALAEKIFASYPDTKIKMSKSQISFYNRHLYACVSFARVKKKKELPENWFVLTLGSELSARIFPSSCQDRALSRQMDYPYRDQFAGRPG